MADASLAVTKNADSNFYVYIHRRLTTGEPFYVGKGRGSRAHSLNSRNAHWKNIVAKDGGREVEILIDGVDEEFAFLVEMEAISKLRLIGSNLVNMTDGGDGPSGLKHSEESKLKMRAKRMSDEAKAKMRAAKLGKKCSPEHRANMSIAMKANKYVRTHPDMTGYKHTDEARAKMSAGMKGRPSSSKGKPMLPHVRAALVAAQAKRVNFAHSDETKRKIADSQRGVMRWSSDDRAKMSERRSRSVICIDTGETFKSSLEAAMSCGVNYRTMVGKCCRGEVDSAHGKRFKYLERSL